MTLEEMLEELPTACDIGVKSTGKGYLAKWTGYKLHLDAIDGGIPISCLLTSGLGGMTHRRPSRWRR